MSFIVAIDGPSGTGKGTVTSELARKLNLVPRHRSYVQMCNIKIIKRKNRF